MRLPSSVADRFPVAPIPPAPIRSLRSPILQLTSFGGCSCTGSDRPHRRRVAAHAPAGRLCAFGSRTGADQPHRWIPGDRFSPGVHFFSRRLPSPNKTQQPRAVFRDFWTFFCFVLTFWRVRVFCGCAALAVLIRYAKKYLSHPPGSDRYWKQEAKRLAI